MRITFELLRKHKLFLRKTKCSFACDRIEYLGHFISAEVIVTDPRKISAVQNWPVPVNIKQLRGFWGLAGYLGDSYKIMG